jgi:serine/threonine protein kinase
MKQLIALNNKNVIRFHEYFVENDTDFMLMEYCEVFILNLIIKFRPIKKICFSLREAV